MSYNLNSIKNSFKAASRFAHQQYYNAQERRNALQEKMKEDPQIRAATYHVITYLACFVTPIAFATYLSVSRDGLTKFDDIFLNIFGPPNHVEKVDMTVQPEKLDAEIPDIYEP